MEIQFMQQIDNSHLVRVADPRRRREQLATLIGVALVLALLLGYASQRFEMVRLGYRMEAVRQQQDRLEQWNGGLRLEEASLRDPTRIYALARQQLGMGPAQPGQVLVLDQPSAPAGSPVLADAQQPTHAANQR